jgi:predicted GNAT family N-acyltransferase
MLIEGKLLSYGDDISEAFRIRHQVFIEELGIPKETVFDGLDDQAIHVIVYEEDPEWKTRAGKCSVKKAVATGRINYDGEICTMGYIAVLKEYRGRMYGDFTVRMLLNKAFTSGINCVHVDTPQSVQGFYQTIGFCHTGRNYVNNEIEYCEMIINSKDIVTLCNKMKKTL